MIFSLSGLPLFGNGDEPEKSSRKKSINQGRKANSSGKAIEHAIACFAEQQNFIVQRQVTVGIGIYRAKCIADFVLPEIPLIIEAKWQDSRGSVEQKFPYLVANIFYCYPHPTIIVVDGKGITEGALDWLHRQVDGEKLLQVQTISEFYSFFLNHEM